VLRLATTSEPDLIPQKINALPGSMQASLEALTLSEARLSGFRPCAILVHGAEDPIVPWSESARLASLLGPRAVLHIVPGLDHIDPRGLSLTGRLAMLEAGRALLAARDGGDPCARAVQLSAF
jgi:hypothetical protein